MNIIGQKRWAIVFSVCLLIFISAKAWAENVYPSSPPLFTDQELDDLIAPVALYPDPLLAQVLPASTYPDEILDAYDWLNSGGSASEIDWQGWDESVKAIARYPDVLKMMAEYADWSADLGDAFMNQPEDVTRSIQRLRWQARDMGNLVSNNRQTIVVVGDYIEILPAQPQYIYVPAYDPYAVYYERYYPGAEPFVTFGIGLMIGSWLTMDFDWDARHVIYHGWNRPGWVNHARPYVHVKDFYVQRTRPLINKNWRHDNAHGNPGSFRTAHPGIAPGSGMKSREAEIRGWPARVLPKPGAAGDQRPFGSRGRDDKGTTGASKDIKNPPPKVIPRNIQRPDHGTSEIGKKPDIQSSGGGQKDTSRTFETGGKTVQRPSSGFGRQTPPAGSAPETIQPSRTPSVTFGGYRGAGEARDQSMRGQTSRQGGGKERPPVVREERGRAPEVKVPENKGDSRGNAPGGGKNPGERPRR